MPLAQLIWALGWEDLFLKTNREIYSRFYLFWKLRTTYAYFELPLIATQTLHSSRSHLSLLVVNVAAVSFKSLNCTTANVPIAITNKLTMMHSISLPPYMFLPRRFCSLIIGSAAWQVYIGTSKSGCVGTSTRCCRLKWLCDWLLLMFG